MTLHHLTCTIASSWAILPLFEGLTCMSPYESFH